MEVEPCRDCGALLPAQARGCPQCARNLEAERILARWFWFVIAPALVLLLCLAVYLSYVRR